MMRGEYEEGSKAEEEQVDGQCESRSREKGLTVGMGEEMNDRATRRRISSCYTSTVHVCKCVCACVRSSAFVRARPSACMCIVCCTCA